MISDAPSGDKFILPVQTCQRLTLEEVQLATNNFDKALLIGCGGFSKVYKSITKFGSVDEVAIKKLNSTSSQGAHDFEAEVKLISKLRHAVDLTLTEYQQSLAVWSKAHVKERRLNEIVNYRLKGQISKKCLKEFTRMAADCLHEEPTKRPTMAEVVVKLESILSQERQSVGSSAYDGNFLNMVRYYFTRKVDLKPAHAEGNISKNQSLRLFTYSELVRATNNCNHKKFSSRSLETIYKGWVDKTTYAPTRPGVGLPMYVRTRLIRTSKLDLKPEEFIHPNLIKLLGYYSSEQKLSCVYKLISGTTLDKLLYGEPGKTSLSWVLRLKIAVGAARGLSFLHKKGHPAYRQFKTACILVDKDYNSRLWDFEVDGSFMVTGSYSAEMGVHYAAPEWLRYQADIKLDVIGKMAACKCKDGMKVCDWRKPVGEHNLIKRATPLLADEVNLGRILDPQLMDNNQPPKGAFKLAQLVLNCLKPRQVERASMEDILQFTYPTRSTSYMASRLRRFRDFDRKSEIYSFDVVLLELLTGMKVFDRNKPEEKQNLVKWATPLLADDAKGAFMLVQLVSKCL
ncbi:hypothetical protein QVD17_14859 [Tagetes erecta]|uniref:Protein kinase domain-containing protein n=1 Tax=Tagetes erecta TaxID=13708 RepID=A0AAD8KUV5_TARER|nr:hypothetical protein QVD17_14859 [Tagetes erecta]